MFRSSGTRPLRQLGQKDGLLPPIGGLGQSHPGTNRWPKFLDLAVLLPAVRSFFLRFDHPQLVDNAWRFLFLPDQSSTSWINILSVQLTSPSMKVKVSIFSVLFSKVLPFLVVQTAIIWKQCWEMIGKRLERPHIEELRVAVDFWYQDIQAG